MFLRALIGLVAASAAVPVAAQDLRFTRLPEAPAAVLDIEHANDGRNRLFLVQRGGLIRILHEGALLDAPFLDITDRVDFRFDEMGLLSMTFPPGQGEKTHFYVYYTTSAETSVLSRFAIASDTDRALPGSEEILLSVPQPQANHNGGRIRFGPDGMLYLSLGDGGGANDTFDNGQNIDTLNGSILRIDVESGEVPFSIPGDNPFGDSPIWAFGLRNPWRISFDRDTGALFIADVGQNAVEEVNVQLPGDGGGANYGWPIAEGDICNGDCTGFTAPVATYRHESGNCSITGGEVYRGSDYPALLGTYLYGDFCSRRIWGLRRVDGQWVDTLLAQPQIGQLLTFGQDEVGNLYVSDGAGVLLVSDGPPAEASHPVSGRMSGQWVADGMNRQGLNLLVGERPDGSDFAFLVWFTYFDGQPYWFVASTDYTPGDAELAFTARRLEGLDFLQRDGAEPTGVEDIGPLTIKALACQRIRVTWDFASLSSADSLEMTRLVGVQGRDC